MEDETQQTPPPEGSIRSLLRKSSDFSWDANRLTKEIESYPKNRRYAKLDLNVIYRSLVELYSAAFASQWHHFKRVADPYSGAHTQAEIMQETMAQTYISHWILDLYTSNRQAISKLTPIAFTQNYSAVCPKYSNEYDTVLAHLNACIRPTAIKGCYEDVMFLPEFTKDPNFNLDNPFQMNSFAKNPKYFRAIIHAIKDKRAGWKTETLSTEVVGRPIWLFDWHSNDRVCSWFPQEGNYTSEDVMYAYLIGVACTPKLAHQDLDDWQSIPATMRQDNFDLGFFKRKKRRRYHGAYEVDTFNIKVFNFELFEEDARLDASTLRKRRRPDGAESDASTPSTNRGIAREEDLSERVALNMIQLTTYIYYARVILNFDFDNRQTTLLALIVDSFAHSTY
jgi:hypothetical protein